MSNSAASLSVAFATYPTAFATPGGGEMQMKKTLAALKSLGVTASYLNTHRPWSGQHIKLLHLFSVNSSMELFSNICIELKLPCVLSPILWPTDNPNLESDRIRHILLRASVILTNSATETAVIREKMSIPSEVLFREIVNGVDVDIFRNVRCLEKSVDSKTVLSIANIEPRKNQLALLEACMRLGKTLLVAGYVRDASYLALLERLGGRHFAYLGAVKHGSKKHLNLLATAGIFALPSWYETPGLSALEAGVAGMPIAITCVGSTRDYFEDYAHYCDPSDIDSIALAIRSAFERPPVAPEEATQHLSSFTWKRAAEQTLAVYREISLR